MKLIRKIKEFFTPNYENGIFSIIPEYPPQKDKQDIIISLLKELIEITKENKINETK